MSLHSNSNRESRKFSIVCESHTKNEKRGTMSELAPHSIQRIALYLFPEVTPLAVVCKSWHAALNKEFYAKLLKRNQRELFEMSLALGIHEFDLLFARYYLMTHIWPVLAGKWQVRALALTHVIHYARTNAGQVRGPRGHTGQPRSFQPCVHSTVQCAGRWQRARIRDHIGPATRGDMLR
jgi:hypothetical protein